MVIVTLYCLMKFSIEASIAWILLGEDFDFEFNCFNSDSAVQVMYFTLVRFHRVWFSENWPSPFKLSNLCM